MTLNLEILKYQIISEITTISDKSELIEIVSHIEKIKQKRSLDDLFKPMKKTISVEDMVVEQNYSGIDKKEFEALAEDLNIEEPIEELLKMLKP